MFVQETFQLNNIPKERYKLATNFFHVGQPVLRAERHDGPIRSFSLEWVQWVGESPSLAGVKGPFVTPCQLCSISLTRQEWCEAFAAVAILFGMLLWTKTHCPFQKDKSTYCMSDRMAPEAYSVQGDRILYRSH